MGYMDIVDDRPITNKKTTVQTNITRKGKYVWKKTLDDCHYRNTLRDRGSR